MEIGVASGFSSAIIYNALAFNGDPSLYSFDLSTKCYFDKNRKTGDAFFEMLGEHQNFRLKTGYPSSGINAGTVEHPIEFVFIDASHKSPWPALDLLSVGRFLAPKALIALHDVNMIFKKDTWRYNNGARDLYRSWEGRKYRYRGVENLGFLIYEGQQEALLRSVASAISTEWDEEVSRVVLGQFSSVAQQYEVDDRYISGVLHAILTYADSWRDTKLLARKG